MELAQLEEIGLGWMSGFLEKADERMEEEGASFNPPKKGERIVGTVPLGARRIYVAHEAIIKKIEELNKLCARAPSTANMNSQTLLYAQSAAAAKMFWASVKASVKASAKKSLNPVDYGERLFIRKGWNIVAPLR